MPSNCPHRNLESHTGSVASPMDKQLVIYCLDCHQKLELNSKPQLALRDAIQQFTGYQVGSGSEPVAALVAAMGLDLEEWQEVKEQCDWLNPKIIAEVDQHFTEEASDGSAAE